MRHVPKKLTDCPENLRESIDWLIQVRHGNGDGLGELSQALKKLIEEAIEKATKSLDDRQSKLFCHGKGTDTPSDSSSSDSGVQPCCQQQDAEIDKLKKSLTENAKNDDGKDSIKSQIKKAEDAKNDCAKTHHLSKEEREQGLEEVEQQREIVKELSEFTKTLDKNDNNNILNNLCSGLEKFLGFNSDSKGYDGTGIVYSDLDRLCDAVMGFLSGVLSNIKKHLGQHKETIQPAIDALNKNKHLGKNGFNVAIGAVVAGVRGYNKAVKKSNEQVKEAVEELQEKVNDAFVDSVKAVLVLNDAAGKPLNHTDQDVRAAETFINGKVENCEISASAFRASLSVHNETINNFNTTLRDRVRNVDKSVEHEKTRLRKVVDKERENFSTMEKQVESAMEGLKCNVNKRIKVNVEKLVTDLRSAVKKILQKLQEISQLIAEYYSALEKWTEFAKSDLEASRRNVNIILTEINEGSGSQQYITQTKSAASQLKVEAVQVFDAAEHTKEEVERLIGEVTGKIGDLNEALRIDLGHVKQDIHSAIDIYLRKYVTAVGEKINQIMDQKTGLQAIETQIVDEYSKRFKTAEDVVLIVEGWLTDILGENTRVRLLIAQHIQDSTNASKIREEFKKNVKMHVYKGSIKEISDVIRDKLKENIINESVRAGQAKIENQTNAKDNIEAVYECLTTFAAAIQGKIAKNTIRPTDPALINGIADEIEKVMVQEVYPPSSSKEKPYLREAVKEVLRALYSKANLVAEELRSLTGEGKGGGNIGKNLDAATKVAKVLSGNLQQALLTSRDAVAFNSAKPYSGSGAVDLNANVQKTISDALDKHVGKNEDGELKMVDLEKLTTYSRTQGGRGSKKDLDDAVTAVTKDGLSSLSSTIGGNGPIKRNIFDEQLQHAVRHLDNLRTAIKRAGGDVNLFLDSLGKGRIDEDLTKIKKNIDTLHSGPVAEAIKLSKAFDDYAVRLSANYVEPLQQYVQNEIIQAQTKIVTAARKQYVTTVQFLIYEFVNKVRSELDGLPTQIAGDLQQGYKEFMTKMENPFLTRLNRIEGVRSDVFTTETCPLKEDAIMFKGAFTAFFNKVRSQSDLTSDYQKIRPTQKALEQLLTGLEASRHFDAVFAQNLDALKDTLSSFHATTYGEGRNPYLLEAFKRAFTALVGEFGKAYISRYSKKTIPWERITKAQQDKYAKICLSSTPILFSAVKEFVERLEDESGKWQKFRIYPSSSSDSSLHALFLNENGYDVGLPVNSSQGTLNHSSDFTGRDVFNHLTSGEHKLFESSDSSIISSALRSGSHVIPVQYSDHEGLIPELYDYLGLYFNVSHLIFHHNPKSPCNIYEMLLWCAGLQFNPVYDKLESYFKELFPKPKELGGEPYSKIDPAKLSFVATTTIQPKQLSAALHEICSQSYAVVTAILGHGHADGLYACDIANNSLTLHYPAVPSQCFDTLVELLLRMYQQLHFLYEQCSRGHVFGAWNKCWYGHGVAGSAATCNDLQCPDQTCNQKHNQNGNQSCKQHAECGLKSPLQSFLEDGLQGFLPHHVTTVGCGITCAMSNHKGIPCRTPMGFSDLSIKASHRQTGKYLEDVLADLCGKPDKPLSQFCSLVTCLLQRTPQTLGDMFAFYYNLLDKWNSNDGHKRHAFVNAVQQSNFGDTKTTLEISPLFGHTDHTSETHPNADPYSLVKCEYNGGDAALPCGPYLRPLVRDIYNTFSAKNASRYLSWVVYLTETFYDLLKKLYDDCCATCDKQGTRCHDKSCAEKCKVTYKDEKGNFSTPSKTTKHGKECSTIVKCPYTLSTLCRYGFYFESSWRMSGERSVNTKRTCIDLCRALERVLSKKESDGAALATLIYKSIPNFLWNIRSKFFWTTVALWSLSLFYLICVMVGRLDVLHIRSHLRIPSSHKIAAQSLLAAAQVGRLAKISYLQP